ncbi:MAG: calcium/sodium antiporter [Granulosicoccus sp.]|nr:calcium/sodium antiporter [Granulosicoccus sp.]
MLLFLLAIVIGCLGLYYGGDLLLKGASVIGRRLGWSAAITGFVLISLGTSAPELFVSVGAAIQGLGDMAAGNVVGSNIVNIAIVLGLGALIMPLSINHSVRVHQLPLMVGLTLAGYIMLLDGLVGRLEGLALLGTASAAVWWAMRVDGVQDLQDPKSGEDAQERSQRLLNSLVSLIAGVVFLVIGAEGLIWGGVGLARYFGVPSAIVALTVTSVGTGLPEITATVLAVLRRNADMAVGNVVGSNLLNIGLVLGMSAFISPIDSHGVQLLPLSIMLALSLILAILAWHPGYVARWMGGSLLAAFVAYLVLLVR